MYKFSVKFSLYRYSEQRLPKVRSRVCLSLFASNAAGMFHGGRKGTLGRRAKFVFFSVFTPDLVKTGISENRFYKIRGNFGELLNVASCQFAPVSRAAKKVCFGLIADLFGPPMISNCGSIPAISRAFQQRPLSDQQRKSWVECLKLRYKRKLFRTADICHFSHEPTSAVQRETSAFRP